MFIPGHDLALLMMIASAICWGSWANTYKGVKNYRFELFYWDYAIGIFLISLILALTMGSTGHDSSSFLNNIHSADTSNIISTMIGGAIFNLANLLLARTLARQKELSIRTALGAQRRDVLQLIIGQGLKLVLSGVAVSLVCATVLTRALQGLLFGVSATDPLTFTGVSGLLVLAALLAGWLPARRAARIDPLLALRQE